MNLKMGIKSCGHLRPCTCCECGHAKSQHNCEGSVCDYSGVACKCKGYKRAKGTL
jgi:hypothetical protein